MSSVVLIVKFQTHLGAINRLTTFAESQLIYIDENAKELKRY